MNLNKTNLLKQMKTLHIYPKKSLGQNFLINPFVSEQISNIIKELKPSSLMEIGPGLGSLTYPLSKLNRSLTLVEIDSKIADFWKKKNFSVFKQNALKLKASQLSKSVVLTGNLPYCISNRLILQASIYWPVQKMCLMVQKETAQRMTSAPGQKSSFLSTTVQYAWKVQTKLEVPASDFYPPPQVDGVVLSFQRKNKLSPAFADFIKKCFHQKRKILLTKIKNMKLKKNLLQKSQKNIQEFFNKLQIPLTARAEELSVDQFVKLYQHLTEDSYVHKNNHPE